MKQTDIYTEALSCLHYPVQKPVVHRVSDSQNARHS